MCPKDIFFFGKILCQALPKILLLGGRGCDGGFLATSDLTLTRRERTMIDGPAARRHRRLDATVKSKIHRFTFADFYYYYNFYYYRRRRHRHHRYHRFDVWGERKFSTRSRIVVGRCQPWDKWLKNDFKKRSRAKKPSRPDKLFSLAIDFSRNLLLNGFLFLFSV